MRRIIASFFLVTVLFSYTELHQLLKLPVVIEHYREHKALSDDISFLSFLAMHYLHGNVKDADYSRDMQLPFKSSTDCCQLVNLHVIIPSPSNIIISVLPQSKITFPVLQEGIYSSHLAEIWQPPRTV